MRLASKRILDHNPSHQGNVMDDIVDSKAALVVLIASSTLVGCQGSVTVDMATEAPADTRVADVRTELSGLEFERSDGTTEKLEFTSAQPINLMQLADLQNSVRLFTSEEVPEGSYTGVRLLFEPDQDATVTRLDGTQYDLSIAEGEYAPLDFSVKKDRSTRENISLTMDLRKSLRFDEDDREYTLTPALRTVVTEKAASVAGRVDVACPAGHSLNQGGAIYLFEGRDVDPDDIGSDVTPYATSRLFFDSFSGRLGYALRFLPEGDYTIAVTCNGDEDDPARDDEIDFQLRENIRLDAAVAASRDFER